MSPVDWDRQLVRFNQIIFTAGDPIRASIENICLRELADELVQITYDSVVRLIHKAVCCVTQDNAILCFEHPTAGFQIPKGTVEEGETPAQACVRELNEETGLVFDAAPISLGTLERIVAAGPREDGPLERHLWHLFELPFTGLPQSWIHTARGSAEENGLAFRFFWHPLSIEPTGFHEIFARTIERVRYHR